MKFKVDPIYTQSLSTALARGGCLFNAKGGYLNQGDIFSILPSNNPEFVSGSKGDLGAVLQGMKRASLDNNTIVAGSPGAGSAPKNRLLLPETYDTFVITSVDTGKGQMNGNWIVDDDNDGFDDDIIGDGNKFVDISAPRNGQTFEVDASITISWTLGTETAATSHHQKIQVTVDGEDANNETFLLVNNLSMGTTTYSFTPNVDLSAGIDGWNTLFIQVSACDDDGNIDQMDQTICGTMPDGDAIPADYGVCSASFVTYGTDNNLYSRELGTADNSASGGTITTTIPANLDGDGTESARLLTDTDILNLAYGETLGADFGEVWVYLTSDQDAVEDDWKGVKLSMSVKFDDTTINADSSIDNNDTVTAGFNVLNHDTFGPSVDVYVQAADGTLYLSNNDVATAAVGAYTASINFATLDSGSNLPSGANYRIKIVDTADDDVFAYSEYFSVAATLDTISIDTPTTSQQLYTGDNLSITWSVTENS